MKRRFGPRGTAFWNAVHKDLDWDAHDEEIVTEVCRTLDMIDDLAAAIESDGIMITGSTGQQVLNPAIAEARQQQSLLARLVPMLNLDAGEVAGLVKTTSLQAKRASDARWRPLRAVNDGA